MFDFIFIIVCAFIKETKIQMERVFDWRTKLTYGAVDGGCTYCRVEVQKESEDEDMGGVCYINRHRNTGVY